MAKHFIDETAEFAMPRVGRHAASDAGELDVTERFHPGIRQQQPMPPVPQSRWGDDTR